MPWRKGEKRNITFSSKYRNLACYPLERTKKKWKTTQPSNISRLLRFFCIVQYQLRRSLHGNQAKKKAKRIVVRITRGSARRTRNGNHTQEGRVKEQQTTNAKGGENWKRILIVSFCGKKKSEPNDGLGGKGGRDGKWRDKLTTNWGLGYGGNSVWQLCADYKLPGRLKIIRDAFFTFASPSVWIWQGKKKEKEINGVYRSHATHETSNSIMKDKYW